MNRWKKGFVYRYKRGKNEYINEKYIALHVVSIDILRS